MEDCTAPETTGPRFRAHRIRCQRTDALADAQEAARESKVRNPEALVWSTSKTGR